MSETVQKINMKPSHPGEFIRAEILDELNLSISRTAEILDVRRATVSDLVNEKVSLSPEMAFRIEKAFGISMETMLRMQAWYDSYVMRERSTEFNISRYEATPN